LKAWFFEIERQAAFPADRTVLPVSKPPRLRPFP
jgi:hypothetical protein